MAESATTAPGQSQEVGPETDVLVIGRVLPAGAANGPRRGAKVLILEKMPIIGAIRSLQAGASTLSIGPPSAGQVG
jgi:hypothetical protein